jgi:hypothetical protein
MWITGLEGRIGEERLKMCYDSCKSVKNMQLVGCGNRSMEV